MAATFGLPLRQIDVEGAYLNGTLDVDLYLALPPGLTCKDPTANCLKLHKSIYGLKQSGRAWWFELSAALEELGFTRCSADWGLYVLKNDQGQPIAFLLAYVDDLIIATRTTEEADSLVSAISKYWKITDLGQATQVLGIHLQYDIDLCQIRLSQTAYIESVCRRFDISDIKTGKHAPLPTTDLPFSAATEPDMALTSRYQELVGRILWVAVQTRPDLAFAAGFLGRFTHAPTQAHFNLGLRVLAHMFHTRHLSLRLGGPSNKEPDTPFTAYVDSDWAADQETRRSTSGYAIFAFGGLISWTSRRQRTVAASTMEAEYVAAAEAVREIQWLRKLYQELACVPQLPPTRLFIDNQSAIRLARNPIIHGQAKHIEVKHHIVRERLADKTIELEHVRTDNQLADILTKPLSGPRHTAQVRALHLRPKDMASTPLPLAAAFSSTPHSFSDLDDLE
jgi:hypothetical protein